MQTEVTVRTQNTTNIAAECLIDSWYQLSEGETTTVTLRFKPFKNTDSIDEPGTLTVESGETYTVSGTETYTQTTIESGGTLVQPSGTTLQTTGAEDSEEIINQVAVPGASSTTFTPGATTNSSLENQYAEFLQLQEHLVYAGSTYTGEGINFDPHFREQLPEDASISSLLVEINPVEDLQSKGIQPIWGLIVGGSDNRNLPLSNWVLELELFVLDATQEYSTFDQIRDDLEV